jgi:hypothetical protein
MSKRTSSGSTRDGAVAQRRDRRINAAIALFRKKQLPVVCIQHVDEEEGLTPGTEGFAVPEALDLLPSDLYIQKPTGTPSTRRRWRRNSRTLGVDTVSSPVSARSTASSLPAAGRGLRPDRDPSAGCAGQRRPENIKFVESINEVISYGVLKKLLE